MYDPVETKFLVEGFSNGFDIGYRGLVIRQSHSTNIPFTIGDKYDMWGKIMKGVKAKRFAGPFDEAPFDNFIQSPIGLVLKAGNHIRLIFHLPYNFGEKDNEQSVNACTPKELCSVKYNDLDTMVEHCLELVREFNNSTKGSASSENSVGSTDKGKTMPTTFLGKTDLSSAFRVLPLLTSCICWLVMLAQDPSDGKWKYFVDKCLPLGASISCSHYQHFSNSLWHIIEVRTGKKAITNYLDDIFLQR